MAHARPAAGIRASHCGVRRRTHQVPSARREGPGYCRQGDSTGADHLCPAAFRLILIQTGRAVRHKTSQFDPPKLDPVYGEATGETL